MTEPKRESGCCGKCAYAMDRATGEDLCDNQNCPCHQSHQEREYKPFTFKPVEGTRYAESHQESERDEADRKIFAAGFTSHQESWEEEFDREFLDESGEGLYGASLKVADHIKSFISQLLYSARREERKLAKRAVETAIGLARKAERDILRGKLEEVQRKYDYVPGAHEVLDDALQALDQ